jgi:hypothetical protein
MLMRLLITFCIGVAVTLAWQSYGDAAREMIANSSPQLSWLAPQAAVAQTAPDTIAPTTSSIDPQQLKEMSADLAAVRQKVDQLTAQVAASQEQMARDFAAKLQAAEQDIVATISACASTHHGTPARPTALILQVGSGDLPAAIRIGGACQARRLAPNRSAWTPVSGLACLGWVKGSHCRSHDIGSSRSCRASEWRSSLAELCISNRPTRCRTDQFQRGARFGERSYSDWHSVVLESHFAT